MPAYNTEKFTSEDFRLARQSWVRDLCGDENTNDISIPGIKNILLMYDLDSEQFRRDMNRDKGAVILFGDQAPTISGDIKIQYDAIYRMALPYSTVGCRGYKSKELLDDVLFALEWMYNNMYGENVLTDTSFRSWKLYDWWDWYIGGACPMMNTLMIIEDGITPEQIKRYTTPIAFLRYQMKTEPTPAHMMSRMMAMTPLAILTEDRALLKQLYEECEILLEQHDDGDDMRRDFCCMTHGLIYNIAYGFINLDRIGRILKIFADTPLAYPVPMEKQYFLMGMIRYTFAPSMYKGRPFAPMNGRKIQDTEGVVNPLKYFYYAYERFGEEEDREIKRIIHRNGTPLNREHLISHFDSEMTLEDYRKINSGGERSRYEHITKIVTHAMLYDALTNPDYETEPYTLGYMWYSGDTAVQFRNDQMVGVRMCSSRAPSYECINGLNADGWYVGEGSVYVHTEKSPAEYSPRWWRSADKHLIPGTTVDEREREPINIEHAYVNDQDFVGGVMLDKQFVTMTMDHEAFHNEIEGSSFDNGHGRGLPRHISTLTSRKSYFLFDRAVLCIGCEVSAHDGYAVRTVVDNRLLEMGEYITVNGERMDFVPSDTVREDVRLISFPGEVSYLFPEAARLVIRFYEKAGERRVAVWFDHGIDPTDGKYAYIILPGYDSAAAEKYDGSDIEILRNDGKIQCARERHSGLCGLIFREPGELCGVRADQPMVAMLETREDKISALAVCDPTQKLEKYSFAVADGEYQLDEGMICESRSEDCLVTVVTDTAKGRTYNLRRK